jgi:hypothetical protein
VDGYGDDLLKFAISFDMIFKVRPIRHIACRSDAPRCSPSCSKMPKDVSSLAAAMSSPGPAYRFEMTPRGRSGNA